MSVKQRVLLPVLVLGAVVVWMRILGSGPARTASHPEPVPATPSRSPEELAEERASRALFPDDWKDSPFLVERSSGAGPADGPGGRVRAPADVVLNGILWDPATPSAVVNNRVVGIGDSVGPWTVVEIHRQRVILSDGTRTRALRVD